MLYFCSMKILFSFFLALFICANLYSQTVGTIFNSTESLNGYTLLSPSPSTSTWLINNCGEVVNSWNSNYKPGLSSYLLEDGTLLRTCNNQNTSFSVGGKGGRIEKFSWNGNLEWYYNYSTTQYCQHHDIAPMPNGNVLLLAWEKHTNAEAIALGRSPNSFGNELWTEHIVEVQPLGIDTGIIVWEWHVYDHLIQDYDSTKSNFGIVEGFPELLDINFPTNNASDWMHANGINYSPQLDQIVISSKNTNELLVIDHSTTTIEAASHNGGNSGMGGDILYRWGNPIVYRHGLAADKMLFGQHDVQWIEPGLPNEGKILIFNNGEGRAFSSVDIIEPIILTDESYDTLANGSFGPDSLFWTYVDPVPSNFYAGKISGAQQLSNGNILVCDGPKGDLFEVSMQSDKVWEYINPVSSSGIFAQGQTGITNNRVFRALRYTEDYSGFLGKSLIPNGYVELNPDTNFCNIYEIVTDKMESIGEYLLYPNPGEGMFTLKTQNIEPLFVRVYNVLGSLVYTKQTEYSHINEIDVSNNPDGVYLLQIISSKGSYTSKLIIK